MGGMSPDRAGVAFLGMRLLVGATFALFPRFALRHWLGEEEPTADTLVTLRAMGARDVALGAGGIAAARSGSGARPWLLAAAWSEGADALAVATVRHDAAPHQRSLASNGPAALAVIGFLLARRAGTHPSRPAPRPPRTRS